MCQQSSFVVLQIHDAVADVPYRYRPVVHVRTGGVMALQVQTQTTGDDAHLRPSTAIAQRSIQLDVGFAAEALRRTQHHRVVVPVHLSLWAHTLCGERDPLAPLLATIADLAVDPGQVVIRLVVPCGQPAPDRLDRGLARLRAAGLGVGLDAAETHPIITVIDAAPDVLHLAARHTAGLPHIPRARAALMSAVTLAAQSGATLIADGCDTAEQAATLRDHGVYQVQGHLLGRAHRCPRTQPVPAAVLERRITPATDSTTTETAPDSGAIIPAVVADLAHPAATLPLNATGETARALFAHQPELTGLVLVDDEGHPLLLLDRDRFMLDISAAFGHALYAKRPAAGLADRPRTLDLQTSVIDAVDRVAATSPQHIYDDIVLIDHQGRCQGVLRVRDLVRDVAHRQNRPPAPPATPVAVP